MNQPHMRGKGERRSESLHRHGRSPADTSSVACVIHVTAVTPLTPTDYWSPALHKVGGGGSRSIEPAKNSVCVSRAISYLKLGLGRQANASPAGGSRRTLGRHASTHPNQRPMRGNMGTSQSTTAHLNLSSSKNSPPRVQPHRAPTPPAKTNPRATRGPTRP